MKFFKANFRKYYLVIFIPLIILLFLACEKKQADDVLAKVGNDEISADDYLYRFAMQAKPGARPVTIENRKRFLDRMIENKLLAQYGYENNYQDDQRIFHQLKAIRKNVLIEELYRVKVMDQVDITDQQLREAFAKSKIKIRARHLFVKTREQADSLLQLIENGKSFRELSPNLFRDTTLAKNGGDLGYFSFGDMDENFEKAAYQLDVGEISQPVQTKWGYHIIKVEDRIASPLVTENEYQTTKHRIQKIIRERSENRLSNEYVREFMAPKNVVAKAQTVNFLVSTARQIKQKTENLLPSEMPQLKDEELQNIQQQVEAHGDDIIVEFEGGYWTLEMFFEKMLETLPRNRPRLTSHLNVADKLAAMVRDEFMYKEAMKLGLSNEPEVKKRLSEETERLVAGLVRMDLVNKVEISESDIRAYFQQHRQKYYSPEKVKLREIVLENPEKAAQTKARLEAGEDFAEMASKESIREETAKRGGEVGYISSSDHPVIAEIAVKYQDGQITEPVLVNGEYQIFQMLDRTEPQPIPYQEIKDKVAQDLRETLIQQQIELAIASVRERHPVWVNEKLLQSFDGGSDEKRVELMRYRY